MRGAVLKLWELNRGDWRKCRVPNLILQGYAKVNFIWPVHLTLTSAILFHRVTRLLHPYGLKVFVVHLMKCHWSLNVDLLILFLWLTQQFLFRVFRILFFL